MPTLGWLTFAALLLLASSFLSGWIRRAPITTFAVYLLAGIVVGPGILDLAHLTLSPDHARVLRAASEAAMVCSLFVTGLKLRVHFRDKAWRVALRLAVGGMVLTAAAVTGAAMAWLHYPLAWALALAAIVSPTDPVLASLVSVDDARDDDGLRVAISGEAGLNDATALPLLVLALMLTGQQPAPFDSIGGWLGIGVLWGLAAGLVIGLAGGWGLGYVGTHLRHATRDVAPSDFLALGIMIGVYALAESLHASGFLAAFAAGVGLRRVELDLSKRSSGEEATDAVDTEPAETLVRPNERGSATVEHAGHSVGWVVSDALSFGGTMERLIAAGIVLAVGIAALPALSWVGLGVAAALMLVIRPLAVWVCTIGTGIPWQRKLLIGWFGIRGLGSLNYLAFAIVMGLHGPQLPHLQGVVITVVAISILVHGISVTPLMRWRERKLAQSVD